MSLDSIRIYRTTGEALTIKAAQLNPQASLGGTISQTEVVENSVVWLRGTANYVVQRVAGKDIYGTLAIQVSTDNTQARAQFPGEGFGPWVDFEGNSGQGPTVLPSESGEAMARIRRVSGLSATECLFQIVPPYNNLIAMTDLTDLQALIGINQQLRCAMIEFRDDVDNLEIGVDRITDFEPTDVAQLSASGAGTIETSGSFALWPESGHAIIRANDDGTGSIIECVYYSSRTDSVLNVSARGRLGASAQATPPGGSVAAVPGYTFAIANTTGNPPATPVADTEFTPPASVTGYQAASNLITEASIAKGTIKALWFKRSNPANTVATHAQEVPFVVRYEVDGVPYENRFRCFFRIPNNDLERHELWTAENTQVDLSASPDEVSATLPITTGISLPTAGNTKTIRAVLRKRNRYGLVSQNTFPQTLVIDDGGEIAPSPFPASPVDVGITSAPNGFARIVGQYPITIDGDNPADKALLWWRSDGLSLDIDTDEPEEIDLAVYGSRNSIRPTVRIVYPFGPIIKGATIQAVLRMYRTADDTQSENDDIIIAEAASLPIISPPARAFGGNTYEVVQADPFTESTDVVASDETREVRSRAALGYFELLDDDDLIFRIRYNKANPEDNGIWTTYAFVQDDTIAGAQEEDKELDGDSLFIALNGKRIAEIDLDAKVIKFASWQQINGEIEYYGTGGIQTIKGWLYGEVYDISSQISTAVLFVRGDGRWLSRVPIKQVATEGDIP